jgi:dihydrofolate reductase
MGKIILSEFLTLDGVMEGPGNEEHFHRDKWSFQFPSKEGLKFAFDQLMASDALLLGRVTYEGFAKAWPSMKDEWGFADKMNSMPKFVVSATLKETGWNNSRVIKENVAEEVAKLKRQTERDILVYGSADLVHSLMRYDLIDEYRLMVFPIILGTGKRLFGDGSDTTVLRLVEAKTFSSGVVLLTYQPARRGSSAPDSGDH